jgi:hypothetical protein
MEDIFEKPIEDLKSQNEFLLEELKQLGKYRFQYEDDEAATVAMPLIIDTLHKQKTVIELLEEGLTSEAAVLLRSIYEQVYHIIYIVENPEASQDYIDWKKYRESLGNSEKELDKPEDEFPGVQTIVKQELDEEEFYTLYRKLSQYAHPSLQQFRDVINADEENEEFLPKDRNEYEDRVLVFLVFVTYKLIDKMNFQGISELVKFEREIPQPFEDYSNERDQAAKRMKELREQYSRN